ncbi:hypothetical protein CRUP_035656, partial [Coryphaenoides rupestris]
DVLTKDGAECAICLEDLSQGDTIARLPCLCVYHKGCIDEWFELTRISIMDNSVRREPQEDVLTKDGAECAICLEDLSQGDTIARLPCLCVYHKGCIDEWFEVNRSCPEHPSD